MSADLASLASKERKLGIRDKFTALKHKAALAGGEPTDPLFEESFGHQLSDLDGRHRWVLAGLALQRWHQDLRDRVGEVLRENEGEIYKGRSIRGTATIRHCWMMGYDRAYAYPTVIISCEQTTILKRTMRAISQHGVLKAAKFALKGIPFCDLKLRMESEKDGISEVHSLHGDSHTQTDTGGNHVVSPIETEPASLPLSSFSDAELAPGSYGNVKGTSSSSQAKDRAGSARQSPQVETNTTGQDEKAQAEEDQATLRQLEEDVKLNQSESGVTFDAKRESQRRDLMQYDLESSDDDELPLRFGAEKIVVPHSGRSTTLGGFLVVDGVCFGLTTAHAFTVEDQDTEPRTLTEKEKKIELYDSDWANEDSDDEENLDNFDFEQFLQNAGDSADFNFDPPTFDCNEVNASSVRPREGTPSAFEPKEVSASSVRPKENAIEDPSAFEPEEVSASSVRPKEDTTEDQQLTKRDKTKIRNHHTYESPTGETLRIAAKSQLSSVSGLDWALCELGEWGKYSINGLYLPEEFRRPNGLDYMLFKEFTSTPPLGKVLIATGRNKVIVGLGTGSECSIKFGTDDRYRQVWTVQVEESLLAGDSGSWVVEPTTGDVYGLILAGSAGLGEEYILPAFEIGHDISRVMRTDSVSMPKIEEVIAAREELMYSSRYAMNASTGALDWESDDSTDSSHATLLGEEERRCLLAEVLKHSSIDIKTLATSIKEAGIRPKWSKMALPRGRSLKTAQKAIDLLLSDSWPTEDAEEDSWAFARPKMQQRPEKSYIREISVSTRASAEVHSRHDKSDDDKNSTPLEEPTELLDSNPSFRAEMSRRAWRAKRRADQGSKAHYRKHRARKKSGEEPQKDPILKTPGSAEKHKIKDQSRLDKKLASEQGRDDPDILILKHKGSTYRFKFPPSSVVDGSLLVGDLRQRAAKEFGVDDASRVALVFKGKSLKFDTRACKEEGLRFGAEILCVIKRTPYEELEFLTNKLRTELMPQGLDFISNTPEDIKKRDFEYNKISETILTQILMKSDAVDTAGDENAQSMRRELAKEAQGFLDVLDSAANKDSPAAWHADFIEQKQDPDALPLRPSLSERCSFGSRLRKSSTREVDDPEDLALSDNESPT